MTYLQFHLVFLLPPILLSAVLLMRSTFPASIRNRAIGSFLGTGLVAFAYTTPWDNYLVFREIWTYGVDRVIGTIGYVPIEEYAFFILQPILTLLVFYILLSRNPPPERSGLSSPRYIGFAVLLGLSLLGLLFLTGTKSLYMGLILAWACPVLAILWWFAGSVFVDFWRSTVPAVVLPTVWLWVADRVAIGSGIWTIPEATSFGISPLGLPLEEATFFLVTNFLCVLGATLFLNLWLAYPPAAER